jgi:hypothetical protein
MDKQQHTAGPWRWEFNAEHRSVHLVGGHPQFDLTIMDFTRWGMGGAGIRLRDVAADGLNLMHKLHERSDWIEPFPGRSHHKHWCANVIHPDMRVIAAAPDLLSAAQAVVDFISGVPDAPEPFGLVRAAIVKATGVGDPALVDQVSA